MNNMILKLYVKFQDLMNREEGQDLVEYALLLSLIALAAISAAGTLASTVTSVYAKVAGSIA